MWRTLHLTNQKLLQMHGLLWRTKRKGADLGHSLSLQCPDLFGLISLLLKFFLKQTQSTISINECILKKKTWHESKRNMKGKFYVKLTQSLSATVTCKTANCHYYLCMFLFSIQMYLSKKSSHRRLSVVLRSESVDLLGRLTLSPVEHTISWPYLK